MENMNFTSERISKTATIELNGPPDLVFPLFGALEEKKWADGWEPQIIYPPSGNMEEGMIFRTHGHGHGEKFYWWVVSKYDPAAKKVSYTVSTEQRIWFIHVQCLENGNGGTNATITYTYTGLTPAGNDINKKALEQMFSQNLKDWEMAINNYLRSHH